MRDFPKYPHDLLPLPQQEGYGFTPTSPLLRTTMQSGRAMQRRRFRSTPTEVQLVWLMRNDLEAQLFEAWYQDTIADGASWFEMELKTPQGLQPYRCRFVDIYDGPQLVGARYWRFSASVELLKRPVIQGGWGLYYPAALKFMNIIDLSVNREWPESQYHAFMPEFDYAVNKEWPPV